jgi:hypothetical protein
MNFDARMTIPFRGKSQGFAILCEGENSDKIILLAKSGGFGPHGRPAIY